MGDGPVGQPELQQGRVLAVSLGPGQLGLDLDDFRVRQMPDDVDVVHRQIDDHPDLAHPRREGADAGDLDRDDILAVDGALDRLDRRIEPLDLTDHQHPAVGPGGIDHPLGIDHSGGDRLFDQHMNPRLQQGDAEVGMVAVGCGDHSGVQTGSHELAGRGEGRGAIEAGDPVSGRSIRVEHRRQIEIADVRQDARMVAAHDADAGDADLQCGERLGHATIPSGSRRRPR